MAPRRKFDPTPGNPSTLYYQVVDYDEYHGDPAGSITVTAKRVYDFTPLVNLSVPHQYFDALGNAISFSTWAALPQTDRGDYNRLKDFSREEIENILHKNSSIPVPPLDRDWETK